MNVLVACEASGIVAAAFRARGHAAWSCDLLPCYHPDPAAHRWHLRGDVRRFLACAPTGARWDLLIAHPDCTYLCNSGQHWCSRGRIEADGRPRTAHRDEALAFVRFLLDQYPRIPKLCLENPTGIIGTRIAPASQTIQPYQFGADASKATCLWLRGLPPLVPTSYVQPRLVCSDCRTVFAYGLHKCPACRSERYRPRWANQTDSGQNRLGPSANRWQLRAQTYPGIADAMAAQWGGTNRSPGL